MVRVDKTFQNTSQDKTFQTGLPEPITKPISQHFKELEESALLLLRKDEINWLTSKEKPDRDVEYFLSLGCGVAGLPHLMLDSVAVFEALGMPFVAGAGRTYCCGNPYRNKIEGGLEPADRLTQASVERMLAWGTDKVAHWCTACQLTFGAWGRGDDEVWSGGNVYPLAPGTDKGRRFENIHIHQVLADRIRELGDRVPWKKEVRARVLVEGHPELTEIHDLARTAGAQLLSLVPGVEVLGYVDPPSYFHKPASNCTNALTEMTKEDVQRTRAELAQQARERGANTVSCQHHNCHRTWSRFSSEQLAVKQCVSIVAEALGVAHVDRYQTAAKMGGAEAVVTHTRPIWQTWGIDEAQAMSIAQRLFDPKYAEKPSCACGGDISKCEEKQLISL